MGNYYGSDLNKLIGEECPHTFTNINVDCLQLRWEDKILRLIEYKHTREQLGKQQYKALNFLSGILEQTNLNGWRLKVYIVQGDQPFNSIMVTDLHDGATRTIEGHDKILDWLSFRMD